MTSVESPTGDRPADPEEGQVGQLALRNGAGGISAAQPEAAGDAHAPAAVETRTEDARASEPAATNASASEAGAVEPAVEGGAVEPAVEAGAVEPAVEGGAVDVSEVRVVRESARARKTERRRRRATTVLGALTAIFVVAALVLAVAGYRTTLRITGGSASKVTDPKAPGYTAEARPTDVQLLALTDQAGGLGTMLLLTGGAGLSAPTVVPISAGLVVWEYEEAGPNTSRAIFAEGGLDVLALRLGVDLSFGIESGAAMPMESLRPLFDKAGPIRTELPDIVYELDPAGKKVVKYPAGPLTLNPDQVGDFLNLVGEGEAELNRSLRLKPVWQKVLDTYMENPSLLKSSPEVDKGAHLWVTLPKASATPSGETTTSANDGTPAKASGPSIQILPTKVVGLYTAPPIELDKVDLDAMPSWIASYVPFPTSAFPGQRAVVNLLNGTTDPAAIKKVSPKIIASGATIGMTGNAKSFDVARTEVLFTNPSTEQRAQQIASEFGATARRVDLLPSGVDVQVTVGGDSL